MTLPRVVRDLFILPPSFSLSPVAPLFATRSLLGGNILLGFSKCYRTSKSLICFSYELQVDYIMLHHAQYVWLN